MPKYRITLATSASVTATVEADDDEIAVDMVFDMVPSEVCAQCSGWGKNWSLDIGQWDVAEDHNKQEYPPTLVED